MKSTFRKRACLSVYCEHEHTLQHVYEHGYTYMSVWYGLNAQDGVRREAGTYRKGIVFTSTYQVVHSVCPPKPFLSVFLIFPPAESEVGIVFLCLPPQLQPSCPHVILLTVRFEHVQQGNVSTAFQAQALCGYVSTRHSTVLNHHQAHTACF